MRLLYQPRTRRMLRLSFFTFIYMLGSILPNRLRAVRHFRAATQPKLKPSPSRELLSIRRSRTLVFTSSPSRPTQAETDASKHFMC
jgi:hypothetical protein